MVKVSIIIPIYKVPEKFLKRNIEACVNQTLEDIEIILVDDGSPDNCGKVCDQYAKLDSRVKVIHQPNKGLCAARNIGVKNSIGEYIMFIDGDDFIEKNSCEYLFNITLKNKPDILMTKMCKDYGTKIIKYSYDNFMPNHLYTNDEILYLQEQVLNFKGNISSVNGKLVKRTLMIENKIFHDENLKQGAEGIEFNIRLFEKAQMILFVDKMIYHYCYNSQSITEKHDENNHRMVLKCFKKIEKQISKSRNYNNLINCFYTRMAYVIITTAISGYFSPSNPEKYSIQKEKYKKYLDDELIQRTLKYADVKKIDFMRRITFYLIKYKYFFIVKLISRIRYHEKMKEYNKK